MKENYQKKMEDILKNLPKDKVPTLLLHSCCAPCSSYVLEVLASFFKITIYYYNPNIYPKIEFEKRLEEEKRFIKKGKWKHPVKVIEGEYENDSFEKMIQNYRHLKEGSQRCFSCYELRLEKTVKYAKQHNFDYFTTTLSISPYKNSQKINEIGKQLEEKYKVSYLYADFKKKNGYKRSIELSNLYHLYRQDYCGCIYSKKESLERRKKNEQGTSI